MITVFDTQGGDLPVLEHHGLKQQGRQNRGKGRPAQQQPHDAILKDQLMLDGPDRHMDQRCHEKSGKKAYGWATRSKASFQADGRTGQGHGRPGNQHRPAQYTF